MADRHDLGLPDSKLNVKQLLDLFLKSRRQGLSNNTLLFYRRCLTPFVLSYPLSAQGITEFLVNLSCGNGKFAYYRAIRAFINWLVRNDYLKDNPLRKVDPPKPTKQLLPSITDEQVNYLIGYVNSLRDKAIISLFADSGMRLNELTNILVSDIDWVDYTVTIWGKGGKQRKAPFTERSASLVGELAARNGSGLNIWHMTRKGIQDMLLRLSKETCLPCNPHSFRRGFACNLHRKGLSTLDIMHLGGWSDLSMVLRYTRSITFDDCLKHYRQIESR